MIQPPPTGFATGLTSTSCVAWPVNSLDCSVQISSRTSHSARSAVWTSKKGRERLSANRSPRRPSQTGERQRCEKTTKMRASLFCTRARGSPPTELSQMPASLKPAGGATVEPTFAQRLLLRPELGEILPPGPLDQDPDATLPVPVGGPRGGLTWSSTRRATQLGTIVSEDGGSAICLRDAALAYAEQGIKVFPLHSTDAAGVCSCGKPRCGSPGSIPHASRSA